MIFGRIYLYLIIIIVVLVAVILSITLTQKNTKTVESETEPQEEIELEETEELPAFDTIVYAVVDSYDGYIEMPKDATYPEKLLDYLEEWTVSGSRKLPGRTYLMNRNLSGKECKWISFNNNEYCVLE